MNCRILVAAILFAASTQVVFAQFGSGIVFDPTQSGHAVQQIAQGSRLYTTTVQTTKNVIAAYNLAQRMASLPQTLYSSYSNLGRQEWIQLSRPANTYGNSSLWMNAATTGYGAASANQTASLPRTGQMSGYASLGTQGQQAIAAQGATVDLSDSVNTSNLQTVGTIRANAAQREADISQLEAASHSTDPTQHTEMATLQRINQALLIELRTQQESNQMLEAQALQQIVGQKVQQDNLKSLFVLGNSYQQSFDAVTPQQSSVGTHWAFHY
jgi:hypothetical protein